MLICKFNETCHHSNISPKWMKGHSLLFDYCNMLLCSFKPSLSWLCFIICGLYVIYMLSSFCRMSLRIQCRALWWLISSWDGDGVCVCVCVREREEGAKIKQETLIQDKFRGNTCNETLRTNLTLLLSESSCAGGWVLSLLNWTPGELSGSRPGMDSTHESCALNLWTPCRRSRMTCMAPGSPVCSLPWIWCHLGWAAAWALACMWSPGLWLRKWQDLEWSCPSLLQLWHPFCQVKLYDFS